MAPPPIHLGACRPSRLARAIAAAVALSLVVLAAVTPAQAHAVAQNSADRMIFWVRCSELAALSDTELDAWKRRGVGGFACVVRHLRGMGGTQDFSGDPHASLADARYELQRQLRDSRIAERAAARGMKLYLGAYLVNYNNFATPLVEWFDDRGWSQVAIPRIRGLAGAARLLGFAGLAFDQELYAQSGGRATASWDWDYPGNAHPEAQVRARATRRGREVMEAMVSAFPGMELMVYDTDVPESWAELVQLEVNGFERAYRDRLHIDFWDGLSSVEGYGAIRLVDATFYKIPHLGTWETALQHNANQIYAYLSRRLSNWSYASSRLHVSPFSWIDRGPCGCGFDRERSPQQVAEQLMAFRRWGTGGEFANYAWGGLRRFDYSPYEDAMRAATTPANVDAQRPTLTVSAEEAGPGTIRLEGSAGDNLAIRVVRWRTDAGDSGTAEMRWEVRSGSYRHGYDWQMRWSAPAIPLGRGPATVKVTVEDIKGLETVRTVDVHGGRLSLPGSGGSADRSPLGSGPGERRVAHTKRLRAKRLRARRLRARRALRRCVRRASTHRNRARRAAAQRRCRAAHSRGKSRARSRGGKRSRRARAEKRERRSSTASPKRG